MTNRYSRAPRRPPRQGPGCLGAVAWLGVALLALAAVYGLIARPAISSFLGQQAADQLGAPASAPTAGAEGQIAEQAGQALPGAVAALPPGELVISEQEANGLIAANPEALGPLERVGVRFSGGRAFADVAAYGVTGTASTGLAAQDGRLIAVDPQLDGPLGLVLSGRELAGALVDRLNAELAAQGRAISDVRIEEGRLVLVTQ